MRDQLIQHRRLDECRMDGVAADAVLPLAAVDRNGFGQRADSALGGRVGEVEVLLCDWILFIALIISLEAPQ